DPVVGVHPEGTKEIAGIAALRDRYELLRRRIVPRDPGGAEAGLVDERGADPVKEVLPRLRQDEGLIDVAQPLVETRQTRELALVRLQQGDIVRDRDLGL